MIKAEIFSKLIKEYLQKLKKIEGVDAAVMVNYDGFVIGSTSEDIDADAIAALSAVMVGAAKSSIQTLRGGILQNIQVEGSEKRYIYLPIGNVGIIVVALMRRDINFFLVREEISKLTKKLHRNLRKLS